MTGMIRMAIIIISLFGSGIYLGNAWGYQSGSKAVLTSTHMKRAVIDTELNWLDALQHQADLAIRKANKRCKK